MSNNRPNFRGNPLEYIGFFEDVTANFGDWVANGTPGAGSIPEAVQQRYRDICDDWSNAPSWVDSIGTPSRKAISNVCSPWLGSQGSGDPVSSPPGFIDVAEQFSGQDFPDGLRINTSTGGTFPVCYRGYVVNFVNESQGFINITFENCDGTFVTTNASNFEILDVGCCDGRQDPPPSPDPVIGPNPNPRPDPGLDPEDEPFDRTPGQPLIPMPGIDDPFGDPIQLPNFPLPAIDSPSLFPGDEPPLAEPGEPGDPETISGDEEALGEADEDEVLTGVLVEVDSAPIFARTVQNVSVPTYIGGCYVYLGWAGQLDLQPEGQFLVNGQFFATVPGMTHWRVRSAVGFSLTITPYYAPRESG